MIHDKGIAGDMNHGWAEVPHAIVLRFGADAGVCKESDCDVFQ